MCLTTKSELKTAKEDLYTIKVFIIRYNKLFSPYRNTKWKIGIEKVVKLATKKKINEYVDVGLHSFIKPSSKFNDLSKYYKIMICKIPKGSIYYLGQNGDIVSNKLEIVERGWEFSKYTPGDDVSILYATRKALKLLTEKYGKQQY